MSKFKVGDKVRRVRTLSDSNSFKGMSIGDVSTVTDIGSFRTVRLADFSGAHAMECLELISDPHMVVQRELPNGMAACYGGVFNSYGEAKDAAERASTARHGYEFLVVKPIIGFTTTYTPTTTENTEF